MATVGQDQAPVDSLGVSNVSDLVIKEKASGLVIKTFNAAAVLMGFFFSKTTNGTQAELFPVIDIRGESIGVKPALTGTDEVEVTNLVVEDKQISLEPYEYSAIGVSRPANKLLSFSLLKPAAEKIGNNLAFVIETKIAAKLQAATEQVGIGGLPDGQFLVDTDLASVDKAVSGRAHVQAIFDANKLMDDELIPKDGRVYWTDVTGYYSLFNDERVLNSDTSMQGGVDRYQTKRFIANTEIRISHHLKMDNGFIGYLCLSDAVGILKLMEPATETNYIPQKFADLLASIYQYGIDTLQPGLVVGVRDNASPIT